ncbi:MAG: hypothetical protein U9Q81_17585 [Pseudomonadota bacterium]|nr:hypothetical protein [Pseudomonadota bacterium]
MATLFFAREGSDLDRTTQGIQVTLSEFLKHFGDHASKHFVDPPAVNPDKKRSRYSPYTLVVLEIAKDEGEGTYAKAGYYYFPGLSPQECAATLSIDMPN